jgi:hypothetical protein
MSNYISHVERMETHCIHIPLLPHLCYMPCYFILLDLIILIILGKE